MHFEAMESFWVLKNGTLTDFYNACFRRLRNAFDFSITDNFTSNKNLYIVLVSLWLDQSNFFRSCYLSCQRLFNIGTSKPVGPACTWRATNWIVQWRKFIRSQIAHREDKTSEHCVQHEQSLSQKKKRLSVNFNNSLCYISALVSLSLSVICRKKKK